MNIYDKDGLKKLLGVGSNTAYSILREYGFRIGYADHSPMRITEEGVRAWIAHQQTVAEPQSTSK